MKTIKKMSSVGKETPVNDWYAFLGMTVLCAVGILVWWVIVPQVLYRMYEVPYHESRFVIITLYMTTLALFIGLIALSVYWPSPHQKSY